MLMSLLFNIWASQIISVAVCSGEKDLLNQHFILAIFQGYHFSTKIAKNVETINISSVFGQKVIKLCSFRDRLFYAKINSVAK